MSDRAPTQIRLANTLGAEVDLVALGARIQALRIPVRGDLRNVVLGYADASSYQADPFFMGATIGRMAGRIRNGRFKLQGRTIQVETQGDQFHHSLHGGSRGFHSRNWGINSCTGNSVTFEYLSADGEAGYPGAVNTKVCYTLSDKMRLTIEFAASSDADTVLNLTNHAYFNLSGEDTIDQHSITLSAAHYTDTDSESIPTGEIKQVDKTPLDLRRPAILANRLTALGCGFDQNFVLDTRAVRRRSNGIESVLAAQVYSAISGIRLKVYTSQPGIQFYTGQFLSDPFAPRQGLCIEAQRFPDAPNHSGFPSTVLRAGDRYREVVSYDFEVDP